MAWTVILQVVPMWFKLKVLNTTGNLTNKISLIFLVRQNLFTLSWFIMITGMHGIIGLNFLTLQYSIYSPRTKVRVAVRFLGVDIISKGNTWWRYQMETFSALLAICARIHGSPVNSPPKGQLRGTLNKRLSKQWWGWWFETPSRPLWRHCDEWWPFRW